MDFPCSLSWSDFVSVPIQVTEMATKQCQPVDISQACSFGGAHVRSGWHGWPSGCFLDGMITKNDHVLPVFRCWMDIPRFTPACTYFLQDGDKLRWGTKCVLLYPGTHFVVYTEFSVKARLTGCILLEYREFRDSKDSMYIAQGYCKEIEIPDLTLRTGIWPGVSAWTVLKTPVFLVNIQTLGFQAVFCTECSLQPQLSLPILSAPEQKLSSWRDVLSLASVIICMLPFMKTIPKHIMPIHDIQDEGMQLQIVNSVRAKYLKFKSCNAETQKSKCSSWKISVDWETLKWAGLPLPTLPALSELQEEAKLLTQLINKYFKKRIKKKIMGQKVSFQLLRELTSSFSIADCLKRTGYTRVFALPATTYSLYPEISGLTQM